MRFDFQVEKDFTVLSPSGTTKQVNGYAQANQLAHGLIKEDDDVAVIVIRIKKKEISNGS